MTIDGQIFNPSGPSGVLTLGPQVSGPPSPSAVVNSGEVEGVLCDVTYNWPQRLMRGYFPLQIRLVNTNDRALSVALELEPVWGSDGIVRRNVALPAGGVAELELLLRARAHGANGYSVIVGVAGEEVRLRNNGPGRGRGGALRSILSVTQRSPEPGWKEAQTADWEAILAAESSTYHSWQPDLSPRTFDQLSGNWQAYTSIDSVILDLSEGSPEPAQFAALVAWCRTGGKLVVLGLSPEELDRVPALASQSGPRFEQLPEDFKTFEAAGLVSYRLGFGVLILERQPSAPGEAFVAQEGSAAPVAYIADRAVFLPAWTRPSFGRVSRQSWVQGTLDAFSGLPVRSLMVLMVLFALLMGPVNFLWIRKRKQPMLLLVTVPGIAVVTSVLLLLYGIFSQGLDIKSITKSWAVLDQRTQVATSAEVREVFAGSAPSGGMRPEPTTCVFPEARYWSGSFRSEFRFVADQTDGLLLSGDYFPVRQPFSQMILSDRPTRLRLDVNDTNGSIAISNALGAGIQSLLLRASNGDYHYLKQPLGEGANTTLQPGGQSAKLAEWKTDLNWIWGGGGSSGLAPGSYIAQLTAAPLQDDCEIEVNEIDGRHILLGILDNGGGGWK